MRILFTTTPGRGHYHAMLPLARAFRDLGHDVRWSAYAEVCERLREDGFEAAPAGLAEGITSMDLQGDYPEIMSLPPCRIPQRSRRNSRGASADGA